jgi:hypothetical protein
LTTSDGQFPGYDDVLRGLVELLESARRTSARAVNAIMTATYWDIGRRIVQCEQGGQAKARYGDELLERLATDLGQRFGRGFGRENLRLMRQFYLGYLPDRISQTLSGKLAGEIPQTVSAQSISLGDLCSVSAHLAQRG